MGGDIGDTSVGIMVCCLVSGDIGDRSVGIMVGSQWDRADIRACEYLMTHTPGNSVHSIM